MEFYKQLNDDRDVKIYDTLLGYFNELSSKYELVAVMLYGSQNYNLDTPESDYDAKAIVLPTFERFLRNKAPTSTDHDFGESGKVDVKDVRIMFECFRKQNINFVELLFTDYIVYNKKYEKEFKRLIALKDKVGRYNTFAAVNCMRGMAYEKFKALKHPYPTIIHKIEKFGYDPKQLHHIERMEEFMRRYIAGEDYKDCLIAKDPEYLKAVKAGIYTLEEAEVAAKHSLARIDEMRETYMKTHEPFVDKEVEEELDEITLSMVKKFFKEQL